MGGDTDRRYDLRCPHCSEQVRVDTDVRDLLLASGCVVCGGPLSAAAFGERTTSRRDRPIDGSPDQQQNMNG